VEATAKAIAKAVGALLSVPQPKTVFNLFILNIYKFLRLSELRLL